MKAFVVIFVLCFCVHVESGVIFDNIHSGISSTRQNIRCGFRKIEGIFGQKQNVDCNENKNKQEPVENKNQVETYTEIPAEISSTVEAKATEVDKISSTVPTESKTTSIISTTETTRATVSEGRRVINVGPNCPEGYRGDGKGNCREQY